MVFLIYSNTDILYNKSCFFNYEDGRLLHFKLSQTAHKMPELYTTVHRTYFIYFFLCQGRLVLAP